MSRDSKINELKLKDRIKEVSLWWTNARESIIKMILQRKKKELHYCHQVCGSWKFIFISMVDEIFMHLTHVGSFCKAQQCVNSHTPVVTNTCASVCTPFPSPSPPPPLPTPPCHSTPPSPYVHNSHYQWWFCKVVSSIQGTTSCFCFFVYLSNYL